jgi:hypothetical protein
MKNSKVEELNDLNEKDVLGVGKVFQKASAFSRRKLI